MILTTTTLKKPKNGARGVLLYKAVVESLRGQIEEGVVVPGEKLPSINALCTRYGVSTITVRAALRELVTAGYLESRPRSGIFVQKRGESKRSGLIRDSIAILTPYTEAPPASHRQAGWLEYVTQGALNEIRVEGLHALALHPDGLAGKALEDFVADSPRLVVVTDRAHPRELPRVLEFIESLHRTGVRMVVYGGGEEMSLYDRVISDHETGAYQLATLLIQRGHKHIINIWPEEASGYWYPLRYQGYERAMQKAGLEALPPFRCIDLEDQVIETEAEFKRATRHLAGRLIELMTAARPPDAIIVHADADYHRVAAACRIFGKVPGRDIEIVGYDNLWPDLKQCKWEPSAPLATVDKRNYEIGQELVRLLLARDNNALSREPHCKLLAPQMLVAEMN